MPAVTQDKVRQVYSSNGPRRWAVFELYGVSGNDTIDFAEFNMFSVVRKAVVMGCTTDVVLGTPGIIGPATVALPSGLASDSAILTIDGIPV